MQAAREAHTEVEDPDQPEGPGKGPVTKRQHFIVMRHGERIDEVCCFILICHSNASFQYIVMRHRERIDEVCSFIRVYIVMRCGERIEKVRCFIRVRHRNAPVQYIGKLHPMWA